MTLTEYLKYIFETKGVTARQFSHLCNISESQISRYASGRGLPSLKTAHVLYENSDGKIDLAAWFKDTPEEEEDNVLYNFD